MLTLSYLLPPGNTTKNPPAAPPAVPKPCGDVSSPPAISPPFAPTPSISQPTVRAQTPSAVLDSLGGSSSYATRNVPFPFKTYNLRPSGMSTSDQMRTLYPSISPNDSSVAADGHTIPAFLPGSKSMVNTEKSDASPRREFGNLDLSLESRRAFPYRAKMLDLVRVANLED